MESSEDNSSVEEGINKFIEWLNNSKSQEPTKKPKMDIRAYPSGNIHSKLYTMTFVEGDRDTGRVITGPSNFTQAGLVDNLEFNVELKNRADYEFALSSFNELWGNSIDVSERYIETIRKRTWLNEDVTPYELYLKFLYEYFRDDLRESLELSYDYLPENFLKLEYQEQAVLNARRIVDEYGGVFISDVVGLGKTYIAAMLGQHLDGRNLVIAPPALLDMNKPGSWPNVFYDFNVSAKFESIGKLDQLLEEGTDRYKNVFIDEAHRFRTETTISYEELARICRGKRVILVSATPFNNHPRDILSQIKLFQKARNSTIPGIKDLEKFFNDLEKRLKGLDRKRDYEEYMETAKQNAKEVREKVLKYLMVKRTRGEIKKYFSEDLAKQKLKFPEVADPEPVFYEFDDNLDRVFIRTIELITKSFTYARYKPLMYLKQDITQPERLAQENLGKFMKILLVKRLESSFHAFKETVRRFIKYYDTFIKAYDSGYIYLSKKYSNQIFELLEEGEDEIIEELISKELATRYDSDKFDPKLKEDLEKDVKILKEIQTLWSGIKKDPKLDKFIEILSKDPVLKKNKLIIFSESKETVDYLKENLEKHIGNIVLSFHGQASEAVKEDVIKNFDARIKNPRSDFRILVTTEILSEGVNLHQSNVVINYDIPWNPTRVIQRVGRVNRVDTKFSKIYVYNFFPTVQSNDEIKLKEAAEAKIHAFIEMLGSDARLLSEGEPIKSFELFNRLNSKMFVSGEEEIGESELKYYKFIRDIQQKNHELFKKIKQVPKKARTAKKFNVEKNSLLTFFRKGKLRKFYLSYGNETEEFDFLDAAKILDSEPDTKRESIHREDYYSYLEQNKKAFENDTIE